MIFWRRDTQILPGESCSSPAPKDQLMYGISVSTADCGKQPMPQSKPIGAQRLDLGTSKTSLGTAVLGRHLAGMNPELPGLSTSYGLRTKSTRLEGRARCG